MSGCLYYMDYVTVPGGAIWIRTAVATIARRARPKLKKLHIFVGAGIMNYTGVFSGVGW